MSSSAFPHFWCDIEDEMHIKNGDIDLSKSILCALGYMTRETVAEIKTKKRVNELEKEFLRIRSNWKRYEELCSVFPLLKIVDHFTPGIEAGLLQIIHFLNADAVRDENALDKLLSEAKMICSGTTSTDIVFESGASGHRCKIICPICSHTNTLGRYLNQSTGKSSFTIYNFTRHFKTKHRLQDQASVSEQVLVNENGLCFIDEKDIIIDKLSKELIQLKQLMHEFQNRENVPARHIPIHNEHNQQSLADVNGILAQKENEMNEMKKELLILRKKFVKQQKKFSIFLCSYRPIQMDGISVSENSIKYTDSQDKLTHLYFDQILQKNSNHQKFIALKNHLDTFISTGNLFILNHGVTGAGKSSTMFGVDSEEGIIFQSMKYILNNQIPIRVSFIEIDGNGRYDLSNGKISLNKKDVANQISIVSSEQFQMLVNASLALRNTKSTDQNSVSSRSHYFVLCMNENDRFLMFGDLAGFECAKNKVDSSETKFINSTLSDLNTMLNHISKGHLFSGKATSLTSFLEPYLKRCNEITIMYHVMNSALKKGLEYIKDIAAKTTTAKLKRETRMPLTNLTNKKSKAA